MLVFLWAPQERKDVEEGRGRFGGEVPQEPDGRRAFVCKSNEMVTEADSSGTGQGRDAWRGAT